MNIKSSVSLNSNAQTSDEPGGVWLTFLFWPAFAVLFAFKNFRASWAKNIFWAFIVFYGCTFVVTIDNAGSDINWYIDYFSVMADSQISVDEFVETLYKPGTRTTDIVQPGITYLVSRVTNEKVIFLGVLAVVFGFFYSRNLWMVLDYFQGRPRRTIIFVFLVFALVIPFWNLNGFRFWTAAHMFFYGVFPYLTKGKKIGIVVVGSTILVHFAFLLPVLIFVTYVLVGNRFVVFFWLFFTSMFITELNVEYFNNLAQQNLPTIFVERASSYTSEFAIERFQKAKPKERNWYAVYYLKSLRWSVIVLMVYAFFVKRSLIRNNKILLSLFSFAFLICAVANIVSLVPSGIRFIIISNMFACSAIVLFFCYYPLELGMRRAVKILSPALLLFSIVTLRESLNSVGLFTILSNPFIAFFAEGNMALIDIFKWRF